MDLLKRADPAAGLETDTARLRAAVDERIGLTTSLREVQTPTRRPLLVGAAAFVGVMLAIAIPAVVRRETGSSPDTDLAGIRALPGVTAVIPAESGGVQGVGADGDVIWLMSSLSHRLQRISATDAVIEASFEIDAYAEGVVVGGGYVWLMSGDAGGQVLRFDPASGTVDHTTPIGGGPTGAVWFGDNLWVGTDQGDTHRIGPAGDIVATLSGELKGEGLGRLWLRDAASGEITGIGGDGVPDDTVIPAPPQGAVSGESAVRSIAEAGGLVWLMDGGYPSGTDVHSFDPATGELRSIAVTFGLHSMTEFDGALWLTSQKDHMLFRIDPVSGDLGRYPLPGLAGGLVVADGSLWVTLHQPGSILRVDLEGGLAEAAAIVADDWGAYPHRLVCTGNAGAPGPTVILEPFDWVDYGSWSTIQAQLSRHGIVVCADGYVDGEASPQQRAADLEQALAASDIPGPYVVVAAGDGVHAVRLFADGRDDVAGVVLVEPMPLGFQERYDTLLGETASHPRWADLDLDVSSALGDLGDIPLVVIEHAPEAVFLSPAFIDFFGDEPSATVNAAWLEGMAFYKGLSTDSRSVIAPTGFDGVIWFQPDLVVREVLDVVDRVRNT